MILHLSTLVYISNVGDDMQLIGPYVLGVIFQKHIPLIILIVWWPTLLKSCLPWFNLFAFAIIR